jgi:2-dehydro-3-deoxygalactonokinase
MTWSNGYIAVDWGTTNRRAYLIEPDGRCAREMEDSKGVLTVPKGGFPEAVGEIRQQLGNHAILLAGMVGSNRGWAEAPYVHCPAGLPDLAAGIVWVEERAGIIPGMAYVGDGRADVMRGEEVQLLGAVAAGLIPSDCTVCHPGTHNKWAKVVDGRVTQFRTVMTGELFSLLKQHSILSDLLSPDAQLDESFEAGVRHGLSKDDLQSELFAIRARVLLGQAEASKAASYASGLLIGGDVRIGLRDVGDAPVVVMARPELTKLYAAALRMAGRESPELDGERTFLAGIAQIAELI